MSGKVAAGLLTMICDAASRHYGIRPADTLDAGLLDEEDVKDPGARVPIEALADMVRFLLVRTGDPALGLRLSTGFDLRTQGFFGYALLSSLTLRERIELHIRYQPLRSPWAISFWIEDDMAVVELVAHELPPDVRPVVLDMGFAGTLSQFRKHFRGQPPPMQLWMSCPERPHHRELRALMNGPVVFDAPCDRFALPARSLDQRLSGDPYLGELARAQLDSQLDQAAPDASEDVLEQVRDRVTARLERDASLASVARDLRLSARTLQRKLDALGASFQQLVLEARRTQAIHYLLESDDAVEAIAARLGYGDASNFRRAFRRWTGLAPAAFRSERRRAAGRVPPPAVASGDQIPTWKAPTG